GSTAEYLKPAEALLERALALDPDNVDALAATGWVNMQFGAGFMTDDRTTRLAAAEATAIKALSLLPNHALAHLMLASFHSDANRNFAFTHLSLAAALAHLGRMDEARAAAKAGLGLEPSFTIGRFSAGARSDNPVYLAGRDRIYEGMRRTGIPE